LLSIRKTCLIALPAIGLLFAPPDPARGQISISGLAGGFGFSGDDWQDVESGFGGEGVVGVRFSDRVSLGGVFHWSSHSFIGSDDAEFPGPGSDRANQISLLAQPLIHFGAADAADLFVGARAGYVSVGDTENVTGITAGPVAGVGFLVGEDVMVGALASWALLSLSKDFGGSTWGGGVFVSVGLGDGEGGG